MPDLLIYVEITSISINFCYETNNSKTQWLKANTVCLAYNSMNEQFGLDAGLTHVSDEFLISWQVT